MSDENIRDGSPTAQIESGEESSDGNVSSNYHSDTEIPCFTIHIDDSSSSGGTNEDTDGELVQCGRCTITPTDSDISSTYHSDTKIPCFTVHVDDSPVSKQITGVAEKWSLDREDETTSSKLHKPCGEEAESTSPVITDLSSFTIHPQPGNVTSNTTKRLHFDDDLDDQPKGRKMLKTLEDYSEPESQDGTDDETKGNIEQMRNEEDVDQPSLLDISGDVPISHIKENTVSGLSSARKRSLVGEDMDAEATSSKLYKKCDEDGAPSPETVQITPPYIDSLLRHEHVTPHALKRHHADAVQVDQPMGEKILKIRGVFSEPESQDKTDDEANVIRESVAYEEDVNQPSWLDISEDVPISNIEDKTDDEANVISEEMTYKEDFWPRSFSDDVLLEDDEANHTTKQEPTGEGLSLLPWPSPAITFVSSFDPKTQVNIERTTDMIYEWEINEHNSTYAGRTALKVLKTGRAVFIKGRAGTGKTWLGLTLLGNMMSAPEIFPIMIQSPEDWSSLELTLEKRSNAKFVVLIDDIFGDVSLMNAKLSRWKKCLEAMENYVKSGRLYLVITSRSEISAAYENHRTTDSFKHYMQTLLLDDGEYAIRKNEKENIILDISQGNLMEPIPLSRVYHDLIPSELELKEILATKTVLGFPKFCRLLEGHNDYLSCFRDQTDLTMPYIRSVIDNDSLAYYALLLLMVHNGCLRHQQLNTETIGMPSEIWIEKLQKYCFIPTKPTLADIKAKIDSFCGVFLIKTNEEYVFKDSSVYDSLFMIVSKVHPEILIPCSRVDTLLKMVRTDIEDITLVSEKTVYLTSQHYDLLADRVTELLLSDDSLDIVRHPSLCHKEFAEHLFTRWKLQIKCNQILHHKISSEQIVTYNPFLARKKKPHNLKLFTCDWLISRMIVERSTYLAHLLLHSETQSGNKLGEEYLSQLLTCAVYVRDARLVKLLRQHGAQFTQECFHALCGGRNTSENIDEICYSIIQEFFSTEHVKDMFCLAVLNGSHLLVSLLMDKLKPLPQINDIISDSLVCLFEELGNDNPLKVFAPYNMEEMSKIITTLLQSGCEVDASYLMWLAASHTDAAALKLIIPLGVNVTRQYRQSHSERQWTTPLHQAAAYGGTDCVYVLLQQMSKTSSEGTNKHAKTPTADDEIDDDSANSKKTSKFEENSQKTEQVLDKDELLKTGILNELTTNDMGYQNSYKYISKRESVASLSKDPLFDSSCGTALHFAFRDGKEMVIHILTEVGCDENSLDNKGLTPVDWAAQNLRYQAIQHAQGQHTGSILSKVYDRMWKKSFDRIRMNTFIREIVQRYSMHPQLEAFNRDGKSWLHLVAEVCNDFDDGLTDQMSKLIKSTDKFGETPLHVACENGYIRVVKTLCQTINRYRGTFIHPGVWPSPNLAMTDNTGETVIHKAARSHKDAMEKLLYLITDQHVPVDKQDIYGRTALFPAVESGDVEVVEYLTDNGLDINAVDNFGQNLVYSVSKMICESQQDKHFLVLKKLLGSGVDPNRRNNNQVSPLHLVVMSNFESTESQLCTKLARTLIDGGSCVNITDEQQRTPLHIAAGRGLKGLTNLLIETDVDVSLTDFKGRTALHYASGRSNTGIISILLRAGADPCDTDQENKTPLHQAAEHGVIEIIHLLLDKGSDPDTQDSSGRTAFHYAMHSGSIGAMTALLENGADIEKQDKDGRTGLHLAAERGSCASTRLLIGYNADPVIKDRAGQTALHYSAKRGCRAIVKLLLENGADPNVQDVSGWTVLHCAAAVFGKAPFFDFNQALNVLSDLVESGANPKVVDNQGLTASDIIQDINTSSRSIGYYKTRALTILTN